jgi:hypothetical protein
VACGSELRVGVGVGVGVGKFVVTVAYVRVTAVMEYNSDCIEGRCGVGAFEYRDRSKRFLALR